MKTEFFHSIYFPILGGAVFTLCTVGLLVVLHPVWVNAEDAVSSTTIATATTMHYQGNLTDSNGIPQSGLFTITFSLWDAASGGNQVWGPETHTNVPVSNGLFSLGLGSQTPGGILATIWDGDRYLEIKIENETLTPRELIHTTPIFNHAVTSDKISLSHGEICASSTTLIYTLGGWQPVDIPELNLNFSLNQSSEVLIWMEGLTHSNNESELLLAMDDIYQSAVIIPPGTTWTDINGQRIINLEAGTHTLKMQANSATASNVTVHGNADHWRTCIYYIVMGS